MSRSKTCGHCAYFHPADDILRTGPNADLVQGGMCKRFPPTPMLMQQPGNILGAGAVGMAGVNPPVDSDNTCGEFQDTKAHALDS